MIRVFPVIAVLLLFPPGATHALTCAPPQFDTQAIEALDIVFTGLVEKKRLPSLWRRTKSKLVGGDESAVSIYTFKIAQMWKGKPVEGGRVEVNAAPGWGQQSAYEVGKTYLVFGETGDVSGEYRSNPGWCGFDLLPREQVMMVLEQYVAHDHQTVHERKSELPNE